MASPTYTILYCDDDNGSRVLTRFLINRYSERNNLELKSIMARNGLEGINYAQECPKDINLIITDIDMPYVRGDEMVKTLRDIGIDTLAIAMTKLSPQSYNSCLFTDCIIKGNSTEALYTSLDNFFQINKIINKTQSK